MKKAFETEKHISELTDKSLAIVEMGERLNALFNVLEESTNTGVGKNIGNLLIGRQ